MADTGPLLDEIAVAGGLLYGGSEALAIIEPLVLIPVDFTDEACRRLVGAAQKLKSEGGDLDSLAIIKAAGVGLDAGQRIMEAGATLMSIGRHGRAVREAGVRRCAAQAVATAQGLGDLRSVARRILDCTDDEGGDPASRFTVRSWTEVADMDLPPRRSFLGNMFACGQVQAVFGQGGLGKTRLAANLARNQVLGRPFLGMGTGGGPLRHLFIGSENDVHRWQADARAMAKGLTADERGRLGAHIGMTTLERPGDVFINLGDPETVRKWRETVRRHKPDVLWVDPWGDILEGEGFDRDVRSTLATLRKLAAEANPDCGIVILAHARTGAGNIAQAVGFDAANFGKDSKALYSCARAVVNVAPFDAGEAPDLCWVPAKNNNGRRPEALRISLDAETLTYHAVEPLDVEGWQRSVKESAKTTWQKASAKFGADADLAGIATPKSFEGGQTRD